MVLQLAFWGCCYSSGVLGFDIADSVKLGLPFLLPSSRCCLLGQDTLQTVPGYIIISVCRYSWEISLDLPVNMGMGCEYSKGLIS
jgi:hypothetical protein